MTTRDADDLLPAIDDKLANIAEASPTPPAWYDAWMRLGPESTAEDRLAVYRAVRDSRCLPAIVAFSLVAWQIEEMVYQDAGLRDLNERMEAMERAYVEEEGELWPDDDIPPEYAELSWQYDDAWNRIFLAKLEALGERQLADEYRADHEEFEGRCDLGLQFFDAKVIVRKPPPPDELVRVASCWDPPRADVVQMALAREGIPSALGNACFLSWFWHYGNAVGGVTVHVRYRDAQQAHKALAAARAKPSVSLPPWTCTVLWSAGCRTMGRLLAMRRIQGRRRGPRGRRRSGRSLAASEADETGGSRPLAVLVALVMIAFILIGGPLLALAAAPFVVMFLLVVQWNRRNAAAHPAADAPNESIPNGLDEPTASAQPHRPGHGRARGGPPSWGSSSSRRWASFTLAAETTGRARNAAGRRRLAPFLRRRDRQHLHNLRLAVVCRAPYTNAWHRRVPSAIPWRFRLRPRTPAPMVNLGGASRRKDALVSGRQHGDRARATQ